MLVMIMNWTKCTSLIFSMSLNSVLKETKDNNEVDIVAAMYEIDSTAVSFYE